MSPDAVARLTPFQVRHCLMVERGKDGAVVLDPPFYRGAVELTLEQEWRRELGAAYTDPDAIALLAIANAEG